MKDYWSNKDYWFDKHWAKEITNDFAEWWLSDYGPPEDYEDTEEYFIRMSFAFMGWMGRK